jgi:hypothetical protein
VPHPVNRTVLQPLMALFLVAGVLLALLRDTEHGGPLIDVLTVVSLACSVVLFGLYWLGWLLREHELWRRDLPD